MVKPDMSVQRERERALRLENTVKRAVKIATRYQKEYEVLKDENVAIRKENVELKKKEKKMVSAISSMDSIPAIVAGMKEEDVKVLKRILRRGIHPDKHLASKPVKQALGRIFSIIEECFNENG